jgi:hypothetical protein
VSKEVPFDKEKFLNDCMCGCTKERQVMLDKIEQYRETEPVMVKYLEWYRDHMWREQVKKDAFRKENHKDEEAMRKKTIASLRAMADLLETTSGVWPGIYHCELPEEPLLKNTIDTIKVTLSYPWGG